MHEPLKDCPFCGGAASLHNDTDSPCWFVGCSNSACPIEPCHYADTEAEAIATWNRRTPHPTQAQAGAVPTREFLERTLAAMEGVIDVADRKTDEFDALRSCVIDLTLMLFSDAKRHTKEAGHEC